MSSADWSTFNSKVPSTRSLTINGTTQDLSADRTFTIATGLTVGTTPITSGTVGRVLFEGTGNVLQESANFFWDNTNSRLGIGTASPDRPLHVNSAGTTGIRIDTTGTAGDALYFNNSTALIRWAGGAYFNNKGMYSGTADQQYITFDGANTQVRLQIKASNGNIGIGTTTDAGFKLDVNGTARIKGASNVGTTTALTVINSDSTTLLQVQDNGYIRVGSQATSAFRIYATDASGDSEPSGLHLVLNSRVVSSATPAGIGMVMVNGINGTITTGNQNVFLISKGFAPTSGTATYSASSITPTINQTGGANGITRGLYINPTLTSAFDFRAIEVASGITILGAATTAKASLRIPSGTAPTSPVNGDIWFDGTNIKMQIGGVTKTFTLL